MAAFMSSARWSPGPSHTTLMDATMASVKSTHSYGLTPLGPRTKNE